MTDAVMKPRPARLIEHETPKRMTICVARGAEAFGVAVLHGGDTIAFLTPEEAERDADELKRMAALARMPGQCPEISAA